MVLPLEETLILAIEGEAKRFWFGKNRDTKAKTARKETRKAVCLGKTFVGL